MTKYVHVPLSPADHSWLVRKAADERTDPPSWIAHMVAEARARDAMRGKQVHHLDGDPRNLDLSNLELRDAPEGRGG